MNPPRERLRSHADLPPRATTLVSAAPPSTADNGYLVQVAGAVDDLSSRVDRMERDIAEIRASDERQSKSLADAHEGQGKIMAEVSSLKATVAAQGATLATIQASSTLAKDAAQGARSAALDANVTSTEASAKQATKVGQIVAVCIYSFVTVLAILIRELLK